MFAVSEASGAAIRLRETLRARLEWLCLPAIPGRVLNARRFRIDFLIESHSTKEAPHPLLKPLDFPNLPTCQLQGRSEHARRESPNEHGGASTRSVGRPPQGHARGRPELSSSSPVLAFVSERNPAGWECPGKTIVLIKQSMRRSRKDREIAQHCEQTTTSVLCAGYVLNK